MVVVSVTVVTDVVTEVVVDGLGACVVVIGAAVVVGVTGVVTVVGGGGAAVVLGSGAAVWVLGSGSGADVWPDGGELGADEVVAVALVGVAPVDVTAGPSEVPAVVNFTTAYTSSASTAAVRTPRPTSTAGR